MKKLLLILFVAASVAACSGSVNEQSVTSALTPYEPIYPENYEAKIKEYLKYSLKDYDSMKGFKVTSKPKIGLFNYGAFMKGPEGKNFGNRLYFACATYNAKNSYGGYIGYKVSAYFFDAGILIRAGEGDRNPEDFGTSDWKC